jgi:hypothetical protein
MMRFQVECQSGESRLLAWMPRADCVLGRLIDAPCPFLYERGDKRYLEVISLRMRVIRAYPSCGIEEAR